MNHPSGMPYGQMPMPGGHRRHDMPYPPMPPNMRPQPGYQAYYHAQMAPPMQQYPQHYPQQWYQYQQHMQHHPPAPQPRPYQHQPPPQHSGHYAPLVVSSYPQPQMSHPNAHVPPPPPFTQHSPAPAPIPSPSQLKEPFSPVPPSVSSSANIQQETPPSTASTPSELVSQTPTAPPAPTELFHPPVPWLSVGEELFPGRALRRKRKVTRSSLATEPVVFPLADEVVESQPIQEETDHGLQKDNDPSPSDSHAANVSVPDQIGTPTPQTSDAPSDTESTQATTPSSTIVSQTAKSQQTPTQPKSRPVVPIMPAVPIFLTSPTISRRPHRDSVVSIASKLSGANENANEDLLRTQLDAPAPPTMEVSPEGSEQTSKTASPPAPPKSWADLVRSKAPLPALGLASAPVYLPNQLTAARSETLSDVLSTMIPNGTQIASKMAFLQPRGLVNNGNTCYMNSVLQILIFCVPFYDFLDKIAQKAAHRFKSDTPVIDAMIMFMREFKTIDSAQSVEQFQLRLKPEDFENFGDAFTPEYVYSAIRDLPRFRDMHRGHQQDAQEFLGFLLEELHEECAHAMKSGSSVNSITSGTSTPVGSTSNTSELPDTEGGWMEVGHKQKAAITRSSGTIANESPVTQIFGGKLRSELKVSGSKNSVTLEPYQPLQLDIGSPQVNNIVDALKGLTRSESMHGDFYSTRGQKATATKQVFIETLPPVLILHLKRFHYDSVTKRAEKIWKKVGYPLELEIPKEVFPISTRNKMAAHGGLPKYRLTGVIYHHGKTANLGHYTVDIRRQDGHEWIRLDDTVIRRVRKEDVAEAGSEEDPKVLAAALEKHKQQNATGGNMFEQIDQEEDEENRPDKAWSQVNGHSRTKSTMSAIINGTSTPMKDTSGRQTPSQKTSVKDNKVAYLLFYQRI